jgi:rhodanese-related sulfurtransferase
MVSLLLLLTTSLFAADIRTVAPEALRQELQSKSAAPLVVDVREPSEFAEGHIEGALLAPLAEVEKGVAKVAKDRSIVLVCHSGRRSAKAYERLAAEGYRALRNLDGGMMAWEQRGYPVVK